MQKVQADVLDNIIRQKLVLLSNNGEWHEATEISKDKSLWGV